MAGNSKIGHARCAILVEQNVLRLHVAVDDLALVRSLKPSSDLDREGNSFGDVKPLELAYPLLQRLPVDVLEHDVRRLILLVGVDHADDVRRGELGDRFCFAPEALQLLALTSHLAVHDLDCHPALECQVMGAVDGRHSATTDHLVDLVATAEDRADRGAHSASVARLVKALLMIVERLIGGVQFPPTTIPAGPSV